jgi:hypothetical protein
MITPNWPKINGTWTQYSDRNVFGFFRWLLTNFLVFPAENSRKSSGKSGDIPVRNTASKFHWFPELFCRNWLVCFALGYGTLWKRFVSENRGAQVVWWDLIHGAN